MPKSSAQTPMMEQWTRYRSQLPADTLLLFRLGDFYEMFYQDAEDGAAPVPNRRHHAKSLPVRYLRPIGQARVDYEIS